MKKVLLFTTDPDEASFVSQLAVAYRNGAEYVGAPARIIAVDRLHFTYMLHTAGVSLRNLEPDLRTVRNLILDSNHLVFFTGQHMGTFDFKLYAFLNRLFTLEAGMPCKALWQSSDFFRKTVRIISVLDRESNKLYKQSGRKLMNPPVSKHHLRLFGMNTVRTTALGGVDKGVFNDYYFKWIRKMQLLGREQY